MHFLKKCALLTIAGLLVLPVLHSQTVQPTTVQLTNAQCDALTGQYSTASDPDRTFSLFNRNGSLEMESETMPPDKLRPINSSTLQAEEGIKLHFFLNEKLQATAFNLDDEVYQRIGPPVAHHFRPYTREEYMIPMRDGVHLHTVLLRPTDISTPLPFLIQRTPYGVEETTMRNFHMGRPQLAQEGYLYVAQDIRGRYASEGEFVMMRPLADHKNPKAVDESTDTYDTVQWLLTHVTGNNGRAGFVGTSYPGFLAMMAGIDPHPAVKAISPQAPMIDVWLGDDFFHNGAFRQSYGHDYTLSMERSKEFGDVTYGKKDGYDYFLKAKSFQGAAKKSGTPELPTFHGFLEHPTYDQYWQARGVAQWLTKVTVPTLSVGGYYDQEDMYGPQEEYKRLEAVDTNHQNYLALGPWRHGSWAATTRHLGALQYGEAIGKEFREQIEAPFFAFFLKDKPGFDLKNTVSFQTGSNTWKRYDEFPPATEKSTSVYLAADKTLLVDTSTWEKQGKVSWISDPKHPVPYRVRPIQPTYSDGSEWYNWLVADQRFVACRKDVAIWRKPLTSDLTVTGEVFTDLFASTSGTDSDWIVKVIDQYPKDDADPKMRGYQLITNAEIFRGRYREGFDKPTAIEADKPLEYKFSLHDVDHVFKKGHTLIVEVQSTWFPLYDRNPQKFVPSIMTSKPRDFKKATQTIWFDKEHPSAVLLPIVVNTKP